ncbi:MAG: NAD(P)H-dependent oxidoreductase subunit E [Clostridiales bacterium]|nr:NAD(P)H-dependent oxidoreductase subunit E [Clostridiales bacterium]
MSENIQIEEIQGILGKYPKEPRFALAALQDMQHAYNYIPREGLEALGMHIGRTETQLYAMATFYKAFSLTPRGKHIIKVCDGTACHIRGSANLIDGIARTIGIGPGETTADGEFSLELVNCLGACALAPVMVIDGAHYGGMTAEKLPKILESCKKSTAKEAVK